MLHEAPTREQEAMAYWMVMQTSLVNVSLSEYRDELQMIGQHCQSDVLRAACDRNARRFDRLGRRSPKLQVV